MNKKNDKFIVVIFCVILFGVLCFYPVQYVLISKGIVTVSYDNFKSAKQKSGFLSSITNKVEQVKTSVDNRVTNYFPLYSQINYLFSDVNYEVNKALLYRDMEFVPMGVNSDSEYIFKNKDNSNFVLESHYSDSELDSRYQEMVSLYNSLVMDGVDLYIYLPSRYEFTDLVSSSISVRQMKDYVSSFIDDLDSSIQVTELDVDSYDTYLHYFYQTDHHWNSYGAYQGYLDIMNMFGYDARDAEVVTVSDVVYRGSIAKSAVSRSLSDTFYDISMDIPEYSVLVNDEEAPLKFKPREVELRDSLFYDYYVAYYNGMYGKVLYDFDDDTKENLLIIGDSYSWQIDYLIASHFNQTYTINIRYDDYVNGVFDYEEFIQENDIDKVLFLFETQSTLFDQYDYGMVEKIRR